MTGSSKSPFVLMTRLGTHVGGLLMAVDVDGLDHAQRKEISHIKRLLSDARLDIRDYELSETRAEQLQNAVRARGRLEELRILILRASEHDLFGAVDVALMSAQLDGIVACLG